MDIYDDSSDQSEYEELHASYNNENYIQSHEETSHDDTSVEFFNKAGPSKRTRIHCWCKFKSKGEAWIADLMRGDPKRIICAFRMDADSFIGLTQVLLDGKFWSESSKSPVSIRESLGMFLVAVGHNHVQGMIAEEFGVSRRTVNHHVKEMAIALCKLGMYTIRPYQLHEPHQKILDYNPKFENCIGALDGTHVAANVSADKHDDFRNHKGMISQNVLAVCDHDMRFIHVRAGWPGSAHDSFVLQDALTTKRAKFPFPPPGKYYLVDSAYENTPGFLPLYNRGDLPDSHTNGELREKREMFNQRHSSIWNVTERTFDMWKNCFKFLEGPIDEKYTFENQVNMVLATAVIHNFILDFHVPDRYKQLYRRENFVPYVEEEVVFSHPSVQEWVKFRDDLAHSMWEDRGRCRKTGCGKSAYTLPALDSECESMEASGSKSKSHMGKRPTGRGNFPPRAKMNNKPKKSTFTLQDCVVDLQRFPDMTLKQKTLIAEKYFMDKNYRNLWMSFTQEMKTEWLKEKCQDGEK